MFPFVISQQLWCTYRKSNCNAVYLMPFEEKFLPGFEKKFPCQVSLWIWHYFRSKDPVSQRISHFSKYNVLSEYSTTFRFATLLNEYELYIMAMFKSLAIDKSGCILEPMIPMSHCQWVSGCSHTH